jgi:hypothetical protein
VTKVKRDGRKLLFLFLAIVIFITSTSIILCAASDTEKKQDSSQPAALATTKDTSESNLNRIDFGNTYIIGQTIKSGAVYLLQRKKSEIKSMLKYREDYRNEILDGFSVGVTKDKDKDPKQDQLSKQDRKGGDHLISQE